MDGTWVRAGLGGAIGLVAAGLLRRRERPASARLVLRGLVVAGCTLAAADVALAPAPSRARVVVLDRSRSVARGRDLVAAAGRASLDALERGDRAAVVLFGAEVRATALVERDRARQDLDAAAGTAIDARGSDLGAALLAAGDALASPDGAAGGEIVLVSDGRDTGGRALEAARALAARGVRVDAWAPDVAPPRGARLARLEVAAVAAPGARLPVVAVAHVGATGEVALTVRLELDAGTGPVAVGEVTGDAAAGAPLRASFVTPPLPGPGVVTLRARVVTRGVDDAPEDDLLAASVRVGATRRALLVGATSIPPGTVVDGLALEVSTPRDLAARLAAGGVDLVWLRDVAAADLDPRAVPALSAAVEAGAALVVVGARRAFGPGGYAGSALEALLPVTSGPGQERERPLALVVALDASGSMKGQGHYEQAVAGALPEGALRAGDALGVLTFADRPTVHRDLAPLDEPGDVARLQRRLLQHSPGGETDIGGATKAALELVAAPLAGEREADRLVVLATDTGDPGPGRWSAELTALAGRLAATPRPPRVVFVVIGRDDAQAEGLRPIVAALAGLKVAVVRVADADAALREAIEAEVLAGMGARRAGPFAYAATPEGAALGATGGATPAYAPVQARPGADVLVRVADPDLRDPPGLVTGRRGHGRVVAAPLEADAATAAVSPLVAGLLPPADDVVVEAARDGAALHVVVRGGPGLPLALRARAALAEGSGARDRERSPSGPTTVEPVALVPGAPGEARGRLPSPGARALVVLVESQDGRVLGRAVVPDAAQDEVASPGPDLELLSAITAATGGRLLPGAPSDRTLPDPQATSAGRLRSLAPGALLALLALLADAGLGLLGRRARSPRAT